jgi:hypothetical protein
MKSLKYWNPDYFVPSTHSFNLADKKNRAFNTLPIDWHALCTYTTNELGFRGDSIHKEGFKIMSIGCSMTKGVGVSDDETWPHQFSKLIPNGVDLNLGMGGESNDYISRTLITFYELLKPDLVLIMYTSLPRREVYTKHGSVEPFMPTYQFGYMKETEDGKRMHTHLTELQNDNENFINWYKNHQLIKLFLESKGCNWIWNGFWGIPADYVEPNRFDGDYHNLIDRGVDKLHPGPFHNKKYAKKLKNYIQDKFPHYLPSGSKMYNQNLI